MGSFSLSPYMMNLPVAEEKDSPMAGLRFLFISGNCPKPNTLN